MQAGSRRTGAANRTARRCGTGKPRPSPFTVLFGSFDAWVEQDVLPGIESGALDANGMVAVVAALRAWETEGVWNAG